MTRPSYDVLIRGARIVDGTGSPWFRGDLAVRGDRIAAIGDLDGAAAATVIDAGERHLTPGFIDTHVHADLALLFEPGLEGATRQGVTTHLLGQDGISYAPVSAANAEILHEAFAALNGEIQPLPAGRTVAEFLHHFDGACAANVAYLVPHGAVRLEAMGAGDRAPTDAEIRVMKRLVAEGMRDGAVGASTGLDYIPCRYAGTEELIAIADAAARTGGVFVAHMRAYGPKAEPAMAEMARIAREARARIHVSHYNVPAALGLRLIDDARAAGVDVTYDLYPYVAGSTTLLVWLPPDLYRGTLATMRETLRTAEGKRQLIDWFSSGKNEPSLEGVRFAHLSRPEHQRYLGTPIVDAAKSSGKPIGDFLYDLLMAEDLQVGIVAFSPGWRTESELERVMAHPTMMAGSDGIYVGARPHPRGWGTFVRYLAKYARDRRVFTIEDAVRRMTSFPARRFALTGRGLLAEGCFADLVLFDLEALAERATFECGRACAEGVSDVLVNGVAVVRDGRLTGATPGRPLRGPAWRRA